MKRLLDFFSELLFGNGETSEPIDLSKFMTPSAPPMKESWTSYLLGIARAVAEKSKDPRTKVGAIAVDRDNFVKSTGFNGIPIGVVDLPSRYTPEEKGDWVAHGEENLVASAARLVLEGATVVTTHEPCVRCTRLLIQAGVKRVIVGPGVLHMRNNNPESFARARVMFAEAGVVCQHVEGESDAAR